MRVRVCVSSHVPRGRKMGESVFEVWWVEWVAQTLCSWVLALWVAQTLFSWICQDTLPMEICVSSYEKRRLGRRRAVRIRQGGWGMGDPCVDVWGGDAWLRDYACGGWNL